MNSIGDCCDIRKLFYGDTHTLEQSKYFSCLDYFTYPVSPCGQRDPDNQGCTVINVVHQVYMLAQL